MVLVQIFSCACGGIANIVTDGMEEAFFGNCICIVPLEFSLDMEFDTQGNGGQVIPGEMLMDVVEEDDILDSGVEDDQDVELEEGCVDPDEAEESSV